MTHLMDCATSALSKKAAEPYINKLKSIGYADLEANGNILFSELVSATERAAGRVLDKERLKYFAIMSLSKLERFVAK